MKTSSTGGLWKGWAFGLAGYSKEQIRDQLFEYIETFYNRRQLHSTLGYESPSGFESLYDQEERKTA